MPFAVDDDKLQGKEEGKLLTLDPAKPPVKAIPHQEYPRCVYKHPNEKFVTIEHRNTRHEVVEEEIVPAEHITKIVNDKAELDKALADGWVLEAYVPEAPPDRNAGLYDGRKPKKQAGRQD